MAIKGSSTGGAKGRGKSPGQGWEAEACVLGTLAPLCPVLTGAASCTPGTHSVCASECVRAACVCRVRARAGCEEAACPGGPWALGPGRQARLRGGTESVARRAPGFI